MTNGTSNEKWRRTSRVAQALEARDGGSSDGPECFPDAGGPDTPGKIPRTRREDPLIDLRLEAPIFCRATTGAPGGAFAVNGRIAWVIEFQAKLRVSAAPLKCGG